MASICIFIAAAIMVGFAAINISKIINAKVAYAKPNPYRKQLIALYLALPLLFLFFPFSTDWDTYTFLVTIRVPITIVWELLMVLGIWLDDKMYKKYHKN